MGDSSVVTNLGGLAPGQEGPGGAFKRPVENSDVPESGQPPAKKPNTSHAAPWPGSFLQRETTTFSQRVAADLADAEEGLRVVEAARASQRSLVATTDTIEIEINEIEKKLSDPNFYANDPDEFIKISKKLEIAKKELDNYETRWLEIDEKKQFFKIN